jgi:hypothetical protein
VVAGYVQDTLRHRARIHTWPGLFPSLCVPFFAFLFRHRRRVATAGVGHKERESAWLRLFCRTRPRRVRLVIAAVSGNVERKLGVRGHLRRCCVHTVPGFFFFCVRFFSRVCFLLQEEMKKKKARYSAK